MTEQDLLKNIDFLQKKKQREIKMIEEKYEKNIQKFQFQLDLLRSKKQRPSHNRQLS